MIINSERLAYGFLRINGFFTLSNFVVHPDNEREGQRTDVDIAGIRFPFREELLINPMRDYDLFTNFKKPLILLGEVKTDLCNINRSWSNISNENMKRVFNAIGVLNQKHNDVLIREIFDNGAYESELYHFNLVCFGNRLNEGLQRRLPNLIQLTWEDVLTFIYNRFSQYRNIKHHHPQWDGDIQEMWTLVQRTNSLSNFLTRIEIEQLPTLSISLNDLNENPSLIVEDYSNQRRTNRAVEYPDVDVSVQQLEKLKNMFIRNTENLPKQIDKLENYCASALNINVLNPNKKKVISKLQELEVISIDSGGIVSYLVE